MRDARRLGRALEVVGTARWDVAVRGLEEALAGAGGGVGNGGDGDGAGTMGNGGGFREEIKGEEWSGPLMTRRLGGKRGRGDG